MKRNACSLVSQSDADKARDVLPTSRPNGRGDVSCKYTVIVL